MKQFLEDYGFAILGAFVVIVLILMVSPVGKIISNSLIAIVTDFQESTEKAHLSNVQFDLGDSVSAAHEEEQEPTVYELISSLIAEQRTIIDAGESNMTASDAVTIGGLDYYVLKYTDNYAYMFSVDTYDQTWNNIFVQSGTSNYAESELIEWYQDFYEEHLLGQIDVVNTSVGYRYRNRQGTWIDSSVSAYCFTLSKADSQDLNGKISGYYWSTDAFLNADDETKVYYMGHSGTYSYYGNNLMNTGDNLNDMYTKVMFRVSLNH